MVGGEKHPPPSTNRVKNSCETLSTRTPRILRNFQYWVKFKVSYENMCNSTTFGAKSGSRIEQIPGE